MKQIIHLLLLPLVLISCNKEAYEPDVSSVVTVEAFLYSGQPVSQFTLTRLIPFNDDEDATYEIEDASVIIRWGEEEFELTSVLDGTGMFYYDGDDLKIENGHTYEMMVDYHGHIITSTTLVPPTPTGLHLSVETLEVEPIDSFDDLQPPGNGEQQQVVEVLWDNSTGDSYYVVVENIETNPQDINQINFPGGGTRPNFRLITQPTTLDVHNIIPFTLEQYGTHRIIVYRVNQEYVDLYETAEQDSRNLTEPLTNIENGLGIFTAFSSDTVYLEVTKP